MSSPAILAARGLIDSPLNYFAELWVRQFSDDEDERDEALQERLKQEFNAAFTVAMTDLTSEYGPPLRAGQNDDESVPLCGVFRFAI